MSVFAFIFFSVIDPFLADGSIVPFLVCRAIIIAGGLGILGLSWTTFGKTNIAYFSMAIAIWTGVGVVALTELAGGASSFYWTMVILTYFTCSLVLPLKTWQALLSFGSVSIFYFIWLAIHGATGSAADWAVSNAGLLLSLVVSVLAVRFLNQVRQQRAEQTEQLRRLNAELTAEIAEHELSKEAIIRSQQLDSVGRLAAGLAHELNNVLMVITGTAECIQFNPDSASTAADQIIESAQRGGRLTSGLLQFARQESRENVLLDMRKVVGQVKEIIQRSHRGRIELSFTEEIAPCWVVGDAQLLSQALLNLALNGIGAMGGSGKLQLGIHHCGNRIEVVVADEGCGMDSEQLARVFEPFFTTKPPGSGTGLGLSMAYGTVQDHGGELTLESELGVGTRAVISIPVNESKNSGFDVQDTEAMIEKVTATAMLVDDDAMVRKTMRLCLENLDVDVVEASSGIEAIGKLQTAKIRFDLVVLDMAMPEMDGRETFRRIRMVNPDQPVLVYSGFARNRNVLEMLDSGNCRFLHKPFRIRELQEAISQIVPLVKA